MILDVAGSNPVTHPIFGRFGEHGKLLMHKKKDDIKDIYQTGEHNSEKDFTPQIAQEQVADLQRDLRRNRVAAIFSGSLLVVLFISLVAVAIRAFLSDLNPSQEIREENPFYIPRSSLPADALWVMDYPPAPAKNDVAPGPKPLSTIWVKSAAYDIIMGQRELTLNQFEKSLEYFQKVIDAYPDIKGLHRAMGALYLQRKEYTKAASHLEEALREEKTFDTLNDLSSAYIGTKEYDQAEKLLLRALEMQPENSECHKSLAEIYRKMKRDDKAIYHFEKYLDLQPNDLNTMQTYALYLTQLGRWKDATDFLTRLTQEVTDIAPLYFLLAQAQMQNGQPEKAIETLKLGIPLIDPALAQTWLQRDEFKALRGSKNFKVLIAPLGKTNGTP